MSKFLVLYTAPASVIDEWLKTPAEKRKGAEEKMMQDWKNWMTDHAKLFADKGWQRAAAENPHLAAGVNVHAGAVTHPAVAEALGLPLAPLG